MLDKSIISLYNNVVKMLLWLKLGMVWYGVKQSVILPKKNECCYGKLA